MSMRERREAVRQLTRQYMMSAKTVEDTCLYSEELYGVYEWERDYICRERLATVLYLLADIISDISLVNDVADEGWGELISLYDAYRLDYENLF